MKETALPGMERARLFQMENFADIIYYSSPVYQKVILEIVSKQLNGVYECFSRQFPCSKENVHIFAHSLGSIISYDLCTKCMEFNDLLDFNVKNIFCTGSPLAPCLITRKECIESDLKFRLYNIYHYMDPIAYKIGPLTSNNHSPKKISAIKRHP
ncbi:hypothetical protein ROZALSC1DRAFT_27608, partial [Rozella allomycis CSF55]